MPSYLWTRKMPSGVLFTSSSNWCRVITTANSWWGLRWTRKSLRNLFVKNFPILRFTWVRIKKPALVHAVLYSQLLAETHRVDPTLFSLNWFLCLFVDSLPVNTYLHIWDAFLFEGSKVDNKRHWYPLSEHNSKKSHHNTRNHLVLFLSISTDNIYFYYCTWRTKWVKKLLP